MDKTIIKENFSRYAGSYDDHSSVQRSCAEKLLGLTGNKKFFRILEIGCGTGIYTGLLHDRFKDARITSVDISKEMVDLARAKLPFDNIDFRVADGEHISLEDKFDLITSNASLQWFEDLGSSFKDLSDRLYDGGMFCFSIYGPETFREFKEVLEIHFGNRRWLSSSRFVPKKEVENHLKRYFEDYEITEEYFTDDFFTLWDFLSNIKHSGTRGEGLGSSVFLGKYAIREMEKTYLEKFKVISATHQVYFCKTHKGI